MSARVSLMAFRNPHTEEYEQLFHKPTAFVDIDGWMAIQSNSASATQPSYDIYDSKRNIKAILYTTGRLSVVIGKRLRPSGRMFKPATQLEQAVRYAYLKTQEPLQK